MDWSSPRRGCRAAERLDLFDAAGIDEYLHENLPFAKTSVAPRDGIGERAHTFDMNRNLIARLDRPGPGRRARRDDIARHERHERRDELHDLGIVKIMLAGARVLPEVAVDVAAHLQIPAVQDRPRCTDRTGPNVSKALALRV